MKRSCLIILLSLLAIGGGSLHAQQVLTICSPQLPCPGFSLGSVQAAVDQNGWRNFKLTLTQNVPSFSFVGTPPPAQAAVNVIFTEDSIGGRTVTFASNISNPCTITTAANATTLCQFEYDGIAGTWFGISVNSGINGAGALGTQVVGTGSGHADQAKLTVDMRDASTLAGSAGVKCDNVTDDTAAIQAYLTYYGHGGPGANIHTELQLPIGTCKITNQLVYEGDNSTGIKLTGVKGFSAGTNSALGWYGPNFGSMMLMLGCNGCEVENVDFVINETPNGGGKAQNGLWIDASNTVTQATYNLSAITRSGNIVTATTSTAHAITGTNGPRIIKVAASTGGTVSFNGTFQVLYTNDNTHVSWIQKGPNESGTASTGTLTNYQSQPSNLVRVFRSEFSNPEAVSTAVTSATGAAPVTITASAAHFVFTGDTVIYKGGTDATYSCAYLVTNVNSSTVITASPIGGTACAPSGLGATGGTLYTGSSAIRIGHADSTTPQISSFYGQDLFLQGDQLGSSINGFETDVCGNTKDFALNNLISNGFRYGVNGFCSGNFNIFDYNGSNVTPDATPQLATIDFLRITGQVTITGAEIEAGNARFFVNTGVVGNTVHLDGISFQANAPTDDIVVSWGGQMTVTGSSFLNRRAANAVPYFSCGNPKFVGSGSPCSLVSHGNFYSNSCLITTSGGYCSATGSSAAPGFIPFQDGSGNGWMQTGGFLANKGNNIESVGDFSSSTNDNTAPIGPLFNAWGGAAAIASGTCGGSAGVSATGWLRGCSTDAINFRNNANTADVNVISKNASDVVAVGGTAGISTSGPLATPGATLALSTAAIGAHTCAAAQTATLTGLTTSSVVKWSFASTPVGVIGYGDATTPFLVVTTFPTANTANVVVCNTSAASITPGAISVNLRAEL